MSILVSPLSRVADVVARHKPGWVISLLDPDTPFPELGAAYVERHLRLTFHDAHRSKPGVIAPSTPHILELLGFLDRWSANESLLVHCHAGIGRSTATAFIAACYRNPQASELGIATTLRTIAPLSRPNETLVALADAAMDRGGRMSAAIAQTGRGLGWLDVMEGQPFELSSQFENGV